MTSDAVRTGPIRFGYPGGNRILDCDDFSIRYGEVAVVAGENGSGKTTLLKILAGLIDLGGASGQQLEDVRKDTVYLHQSPYLFRGTVHRNLKLANPGMDDARRQEALEAVGLGGFAERRAKKLSGGESKRVALARCFLSSRRIVLLDEPAAHVDETSIRLIEHACRELAEAGRAVVVTSHRGGFGYRVADRVMHLTAGRLHSSAVNILKGRVVRDAEGHRLFRSGAAEFRVPLIEGSFRVAVLPGEDVILSREPIASSARNSLEGRITHLEEREDGGVLVTVDCGVPLMSVLTATSVAELELEPKRSVYATFKASSIVLY